MSLATHTAGDPYFTWYIGLIVGFVVVVVVVAVAGWLLTIASRIGDQAQRAGEVLGRTGRNVAPASEVRRANDSATAILDLAARARAALAGGR